MLAVSRPWTVRMLGLFRRHARGRPAGADGYLMLGCFERMLYPEVSRAAQRLLPDLAAPPAQGCCGALHAHNGESRKGKEMARQLGEQLPGLIVTTAGGCVAWLVYRYLGLTFVSRSWFNLEATWACSLVLVGALSLAISLAS